MSAERMVRERLKVKAGYYSMSRDEMESVLSEFEQKDVKIARLTSEAATYKGMFENAASLAKENQDG